MKEKNITLNADKMLEWMARNDYKQKDAALKFGITSAHMSYILNGRSGVSRILRMRIRKAVGKYWSQGLFEKSKGRNNGKQSPDQQESK